MLSQLPTCGLLVTIIFDWACKKSTIWVQKMPILFAFALFILPQQNFITAAEFNGLSSAAYRNEILYYERKTLAEI